MDACIDKVRFSLQPFLFLSLDHRIGPLGYFFTVVLCVPLGGLFAELQSLKSGWELGSPDC